MTYATVGELVAFLAYGRHNSVLSQIWGFLLDVAKLGHPHVQSVMELEVLFVDAVSMIDDDCWSVISELCSVIDHSKRPHARSADAFGNIHVLLFGDFKQLPPALLFYKKLRSLRQVP